MRSTGRFVQSKWKKVFQGVADRESYRHCPHDWIKLHKEFEGQDEQAVVRSLERAMMFIR
jgi:hypothetical protein